jgi:hypothetical protein
MILFCIIEKKEKKHKGLMLGKEINTKEEGTQQDLKQDGKMIHET